MPTHHPHTRSTMDFEEHHVDCDYLFDQQMRCNCTELIMRDESHLSRAEILACVIFFGVVGLFILRILIGIYSIG